MRNLGGIHWCLWDFQDCPNSLGGLSHDNHSVSSALVRYLAFHLWARLGVFLCSDPCSNFWQEVNYPIIEPKDPVVEEMKSAAHKPAEMTKDPIMKAAGNILAAPYNPEARERAEKVYYWPHVPGKPEIFSFQGSKSILY